jgi:fructose-bisphosphate aldolase class II
MGSIPTLREVLEHAQADHVGVGHFNVSDLIGLKAVFEAAQQRKVPVVVGVSEGERSFLGVRQVAALVKSLRDEYAFPVFLNADHTHSLPNAIEAAKAGFDWVVFDRSPLPLADNIRQTREAVDALKSIRPDILVEGEVGDIGSGSEIHDGEPAPAGLTTAAEARQFVEETRIDTLAPAVGNRHGLFKTMVDRGTKKRLDLGRIREIKAAANVFLTLHGASGTDEDDLRKSIAAGISVVHINTELRLAWRHGLEAALANHPEEIVPYQVLPQAIDFVRTVIEARLAQLR